MFGPDLGNWMMMMMQPRRLTLTLGATALLVLLTSATAQADLTNRLTKEEAACNALQLDHLLGRVSAGDGILKSNQLPKTAFVTYSNPEGFYEGLALTNQDWRLDPLLPSPPPTPERYLAFHLNPSIRTLLLNPARPPVGQIALGREQASSNLVASGGPYDLTVKINPTLNPDPPSQDLLEINNFEVPAASQPYNGFLANNTKPGRGLDQDGLLTSCHEKLTDFDRQIFALLQRMVRLTTYIQEEGQYGDSEIAIFRGEEEHTYRLTIYPLGTPGVSPAQGHVAIEIQLAWAAEGRLVSGTLRVLPPCGGPVRLDCSASNAITRVFLISPIFGGAEKWPDSLQSNEVYFDGLGGGISGPATYDFEALLAGTTWNSPVP
jgi:hypothetical protein